MKLLNNSKNYNLYILIFLIAFISYLPAIIFFNVPLDGEGLLHYGFLSKHGRWFLDFIKFGLNKNSIYTYNPFFTILISNIFLSFSAIINSKIFNFNNFNTILFSALYITFPQYAYQYYFITQADVISFGLFLCSLSIYILYLNNISNLLKYFICFICSYLILGIYQTLLLLPFTLLFIKFFLDYKKNENKVKVIFNKVFYYIIIITVSVFIYYCTIKTLNIKMENNEYAKSFFSLQNLSLNFKYIIRNLLGRFYYGQQPYLLATLIVISFILYSIIKNKEKIWTYLFLIILVISPFIIILVMDSYPPRIFLSTNICFSFSIIYCLTHLKNKYLKTIIISTISLTSIFYISKLYYSQYKVGEQDKTTARDVKTQLMINIPDYNDPNYSFYFYGRLKNSEFRIKKSEVFGASFFEWCGGDTNRISAFLKYQNIMNIKPSSLKDINKIDTKLIHEMPTWPNPKSVQKFNNTIIIKLGNENNENCLFSLDE